MRLGQPGDGDRDDDNADRDVDQERQPPGDDGQQAAERKTQHRADALHGGRDGHRAVAGLSDGVRRRDQRQSRRCGDRGAGALHRAGDDQRDVVGGEAAHQRGDREHADAGQERPLMPDRITDPAAEQQQTAERQHVGGDDPALTGIGQVQLGLHARQRDDHDGAVQRRHQLHAGDRDDRDAQHAATTAARWCGRTTFQNHPRQTWVASLPRSDFGVLSSGQRNRSRRNHNSPASIASLTSCACATCSAV